VRACSLVKELQPLHMPDRGAVNIVELRFFGGLTVEETGVQPRNVLEISPATVKAGLDAGKNLLRRELSAKLGIQILRGHKNLPNPAREHRSATLGSLENHSWAKPFGTRLFSGPEFALVEETVR